MSELNERWLDVAEDYLRLEPEANDDHIRSFAAALQAAAEAWFTGIQGRFAVPPGDQSEQGRRENKTASVIGHTPSHCTCLKPAEND